MLKFCHDHRGSISIFLLVIITTMLIFSFMTLDIAKINLATAAARNNTDLAGNAVLTDYDQILKDAYGLFANSSSIEELSENVSKYYIATMSSSGIEVDNGNDVYNMISGLINNAEIPENNNMLQLKTSSLTLDIGSNDDGIIIQPINESAISNPTVMRRQIIEYMKYRAPVSLATGILEKINVFKDVDNQTAATTDRIEYEDSLNVVQNSSDSVYDIMNSYNGNLNIVINDYQKGEMITYGTQSIDRVSGKGKGGVSTLHDYFNKLVECTVQISPLKDFISNSILVKKQVTITPKTPENISDLSGLIDSMSSNSDYTYLKELSGNFNHPKHSQLVGKDEYNSETYHLLKTAKSLYDGSLKGEKITGSVKDDLAKFYVKFYELYYGILVDSVNFTEEGWKVFNSYRDKFEEVDEILSWAFGYPDTDSGSESIPQKTATKGSVDSWASTAYEKTVNALDDYSNCFNDIVSILRFQEGIAEYMGGEKSPLDQLKKAIDKAKEKSDEWGESIDKVETESYKASMKNTREAETEDFDNLDPEAVTRLKDNFNAQAESYGSDYSRVTTTYGIIFGGKQLYEDTEDERVINSHEEENVESTKLPSRLFNVKYKNAQEADGFLEIIEVPEGDYDYIISNMSIENAPVLSVDSAAFSTTLNSGTNKEIYDIVKKISEKNIIANEAERTNVKTSGDSTKSDINDGKDDLKEKENDAGPKEDSSNTNQMSEVTAIISFDDYIKSNGTTVLTYGSSLGGVNIGSMDPDEDGNYNTSGITSLLENVGEMFTNLAKAGRDNLFIAEYLTGMFSCMTTGVVDGVKDDEKNAEESMAGYVFSTENNLHYRAELEYILYGQDTEFKNQAAAVATISSIRFVLNLIYSFTDSEINAFTSSTASAIGALFPFAIPVIKTVLHILLSAAETSWDMIELTSGNSVPIYKTQRTWVCKGTNIIGNVVEKTAKVVVKKVAKEAENAFCDYIDGKTDDITKWVNEMVTAEKEDLKSVLNSKIITPLNEAVTQLTADTTKSLDEIEGELNNLVDKIISDITNSSAQETSGDSVLAGLYSQMSSYLSSQKNEIVGKIKTLIGNSKENAQSYISDFETNFNNTVESITSKIGTVIDSAEEKIKEAITSAASEVKELAINGINAASDKLLDAVDSKISSKLSGTRNVNINMGTTSSSGGNSVLDSLLCMSYKDYLYLFLVLGLINGSESELTRAAQLMQCNIQHRGQSDYDINKSVTMFNVYTASKVKTSVIGRYADNNGITFKNLSDGYYNIEIRSFAGY